MKLRINNYETCVSKHGYTDEVFSGTADGIDFIATHSGSEHCGAVWSNGAISGDGFDILYEKFGDFFTAWKVVTILKRAQCQFSVHFFELSLGLAEVFRCRRQFGAFTKTAAIKMYVELNTPIGANTNLSHKRPPSNRSIPIRWNSLEFSHRLGWVNSQCSRYGGEWLPPLSPNCYF